ncbi:hypothetical protein SAMN05444156_0358 [Verrucomicrobium sp. GAS474]|nr:hypothetical protein SAMN05444156_0358 [Verrucomicrobium sp. GAS474]
MRELLGMIQTGLGVIQTLFVHLFGRALLQGLLLLVGRWFVKSGSQSDRTK